MIHFALAKRESRETVASIEVSSDGAISVIYLANEVDLVVFNDDEIEPAT